MLSDIEIAQRAKLQPISEIAASAGLSEDEIEQIRESLSFDS